MRKFVPVSDEMLYRSETRRVQLIPYQCDLPCWHELQQSGEALPVYVEIHEGVSRGCVSDLLSGDRQA